MKTAKQHGFTIVELLIVVVVIAVLAAITVIAYNGIQGRANDAVVQSDLKASYSKLLQYQVDNGSFPPASYSALQPILVASKNSYDLTNNGYLYCRNDQDAAVVAKSKSGLVFYNGTKGAGSASSSAWTGANASLCPLAGISTAVSGYASAWYGSNSGWQW